MRIWKREYTTAQLNQLCQNTLISHLNIEITEIGDDFIKATMPVLKEHCQPFGYLHGGASAALAETVASIAALMITPEEELPPMGKEIKSWHIRPVKEGDSITAEARQLDDQPCWEITLSNQNGETINRSTLTVSMKK